MPHIPRLFAVFALASCTPGGGPAASTGRPTPAPARGAPVEPATVFFGPSPMRYLVYQRHHIEQTLPTGNQVQEIGLRTFVSALITGPADSIGYPISLTIDSIALDSGTTLPANLDLRAARGLRYDGRLTRDGELKKAVPSDTGVARAVGQLLGGFRRFYPQLPSAGLRAGLTWSDSATLADTTGVTTVTERGETHYAAGAWENNGGTRAVAIQLVGSFIITGSGTASGTTFALSGSGQQTGRLWVSADGRFMGGDATDSSSMVITFSAQGAEIPRRQVSHTTISVLP